MSIRLVGALFLALVLSGCAGKLPPPEGSLASSFMEHADKADEGASGETQGWKARSGRLAGRTLTVSSLKDLRLQPKEVVLTFDDGPVPGKTERILRILDTYHVKATFLMVGEMAQNHPEIARIVARRGHTIGSHTYRHANLHSLAFDMAMTEIMRGERAVEHATGTDAPFFRFPYLADTRRLRDTLARRGHVVLDVDVDSKDYFKVSPLAVMSKTMERLRQRGRGILLLHDIHNRTATMLPVLLAHLQAEGYKVVALKYRRGRIPEMEVASVMN